MSTTKIKGQCNIAFLTNFCTLKKIFVILEKKIEKNILLTAWSSGYRL